VLLPLVLSLLNPATALQLQLERPAQCALADTVVVGEVTTIELRWAEGPAGGIEQVVWLAVDQVVKGDSGDTLKIVLPGGTIGGLTHVVEDVPTLIADQSYVLMLDDGDPVGGEQGAIAVRQFSHQQGERLGTTLRSLGECR